MKLRGIPGKGSRGLSIGREKYSSIHSNKAILCSVVSFTILIEPSIPIARSVLCLTRLQSPISGPRRIPLRRREIGESNRAWKTSVKLRCRGTTTHQSQSGTPNTFPT